MADVTIGSLDGIAGDGLGTAKMRIGRLSLYPGGHRLCRSSRGNGHACRVERWAPQIGTTPIIGISVIPEVCGLVLPGDGLVGVNAGAILHLLLCQRHI